MSGMRIALVNHRYAPFLGGSERHAQAIAESLAASGHAVDVVTSDAFDLEYFWDHRRRPVPAPSVECLNGVRVTRVPVRHLPLGPLVFGGTRRLMGELSRATLPAGPWSWVSRHQPLMPRLGDTIRSLAPLDIVHATNIGLEGLALNAMAAARRMGSAFVLSPFVHLGEAGDEVARRFVTMPHQRRLLRDADAVIVMTEIERHFVISQGVAPDRVVITGAGTDPSAVSGGDGEQFRRRHCLGGVVVGFLGPLAKEKGAFHLVEAVARLRRSGRDVTLAMAGPSMSAFEDWFASLADRDRAAVRLLGVISDEDKRDFLAALDVCALPSRTESFGIVYPEAWSNRKPVIAADAGAVPEIVRDGENGLLVPFGDVQALARAIDTLIGDPVLSRGLGQAGYEETLRRHTWELVVQRTIQAYELAVGYRIRG